MPVLFKFRSSVGFDAVDLGGRPSISVRGLRARVVERKNLQICADSRLVVFDACTGEAYEDEEFMIPDGSSVIIKRVPAAPGNGAAAGIDHAAAKEDFLGAVVSFPSEGLQYQVGDFLLRVGKVVPANSENLRGIMMEVEYLPISSVEKSRQIMEDFLDIWHDTLSKKSLPGRFMHIEPNFADYGLSDQYSSQHTTVQYAAVMAQLIATVKN